MTTQRDWFSSLKMIEPNTWGVDLVNNQKLCAHGVGTIGFRVHIENKEMLFCMGFIGYIIVSQKIVLKNETLISNC
jgi:hypothetical protein